MQMLFYKPLRLHQFDISFSSGNVKIIVALRLAISSSAVSDVNSAFFFFFIEVVQGAILIC